jgi:type I restriction enzyme M protein
MAQMFEKVNMKKNLSDEERRELKNKVVRESIWGTDANKTMSRIARMNMYLHGDGSNRVYWVPDFLDKDIKLEKGIDEELEKEANEFRDYVKKGKRFQIVLTNPPFSMSYSEKEEDEKRILEQYEIAHIDRNGKTKKLRASLKSNVLSLERYHGLLEQHGKLITVIDESVLNAGTEKDFRDFIRKHFLIRAVISLPSNTFVKAEANVKTSVLYLVKKVSKEEQQPDIFMAISKNVGHTDSGKPSPDLNDLDDILEKYKAFERGEIFE